MGFSFGSLAIGGPGNGAVAQAFISNGQVIGAMVTAAGLGFGLPGAQIPVTIAGDGSGATALAYVAAPLPAERRLSIRCDSVVGFGVVGSLPPQSSWAGGDVIVPGGAEVVWTAIGGAWETVGGPAANTLGSPARLVSPAEPQGCTSQIGRGSPQGVVTANPGSDWRNLDGGAGTTLWVKQSGSGATGWVAVA